MSCGSGGEGQVRIAEEDSGGLRALFRPVRAALSRCWGGVRGAVRSMSWWLTFFDTRSSGCRDGGPAGRRRDSRHSCRRVDQRPGREVVIVIAPPARARRRRRLWPGAVQPAPGSPATPALAHARSHPRIVLRGPLRCAVRGQLQLPRDPPGPLGQARTPKRASAVPTVFRVHGDTATSRSGG